MALADSLRTFMYISLWGKPVISVDRGLNGLIKSIFRAGEQGFAYDPNDLTTLYQDAAGTIPVTAEGQPVGLVLDKSKGLRLGVNQMTYPNSQALPAAVNMPDGVYTWTLNTQNPISGVQDSRLVVSGVSSNAARPSAAFILNTPLVTGKVYKFSFKYKVNSGTPRILNIHNGDSIVPLPLDKGTLTGSGTFEVYVRWYAEGQVRPYIYFSNTGVFDIQMNEFSIQEVIGNHAYQTVSASRPLLQRNATTGAYYLAFDGTDDFLVTSSIDFTATDKISLFAGVRKLSDANRGMIAELSASVGSYNGTFSIEGNDGGARKYFQQSKGSLLSVAGTSGAIFSAPNNAVLTSKLNINTDTNELIVNGSYRYTSTQDQGTGNYGNYPLYIGRRGGTSLPFNGHLYSLIGVGRLATDAETIALEKSIAKNTGVTLSV